MRLNRWLAAALVIALTTVTGCGGSKEESTNGNSGGQVTLEQRYGMMPVRKPKNMTYQPDVVIIPAGPKAIRHASADGLTWTLDKKAEGISDLQPGKVMYASSMVVGRVAKLTPAGDDVAVLLLPIQLTDLFKDGTIDIDQALNLSENLVQEVPNAPGRYTELPKDPATGDPTPEPTEPTEPTETTETTEPDETSDPAETTEPTDPADVLDPDEDGGGSVARGPVPRTAASSARPRQINLVAPALGRSRVQTPDPGQLPPPQVLPPDSTKYKVTLGGWDYEYFSRTNSNQHEVGIRVTAPERKSIRGGFTFRLGFQNLRMKARVPISNGRVQNSNISLNGLKQIAADLSVGSAEGLADNTRVRVEVPINVPLDHIADEYLFQPQIKFKIIFKFGFSSKNTTATGTIAYTIGGDIKTAKPTTANPAESFTNGSLAPMGLVIAFEGKIVLGFGLPVFSVGPYGKIVFTLGYANAGLMGAVPCRLLTPNLVWSWGWGANVSTTVGKALYGLIGPTNSSLLNSLFKNGTPAKGEYESQLGGTHPLWTGKVIAAPNSAYCRAQT